MCSTTPLPSSDVTKSPKTKTSVRFKQTLGALALAATTASTAGCIEFLAPGELGEMRYIGDSRGEDIFRFIPPISDNNGNVYHLNGSTESDQDILATVGNALGGGWRGRCSVHKNPGRGAHGWVGYSFDTAYFWSGDALASINAVGDCKQLLDRDPITRANLAFKGVIPWVRVTPTARTMVAMVQSPTDPVPFFVVIDLDIRRYDRFEEFEPRAAQDVEVLGVGADPDNDAGFAVVKYLIGEETRVEARFVDRNANVTDIVNLPVPPLDMYGEDALTGFMQINSAGWVAGVLEDGPVVVFNRQRGAVRDNGGFETVGVHRWEGETYVVGVASGRPAIARVQDDGSLANPQRWQASEETARSLQGNVVIQDDRFQPHRTLTWPSPVSAYGQFPWMYPHSPHRYTEDTGLISIAGPSYTAAGETYTAIAVGPAGLSYP
jgi:hypothetical protein